MVLHIYWYNCVYISETVYSEKGNGTLFQECVLTIYLNLNFLVPFLDYSREDVLVLSEKAIYGIQGRGLSLYELIVVGIIANGQTLFSTQGLSLILALFMSTYYFPRNRLAAVSRGRNVVSSIQFPWRFISIVVQLLTYMTCLLFLQLKTVLAKNGIFAGGNMCYKHCIWITEY